MNDEIDKATKAASSTTGVARSAGKVVSVATTTSQAAKELTATAIARGSRLAEKVTTTLNDIQIDRERIAEHAKTIEDASKVVAGMALAGAAVAAPTGLAAVGVALGVTSAPIIVTAAPVIAAVAGTAATVSAATRLYSKSKKKRQSRNTAAEAGKGAEIEDF